MAFNRTKFLGITFRHWRIPAAGLAFAVMLFAVGFIPVNEKLAGEKEVRVAVIPSDHPMPQAYVAWHDLGLNPEFHGDWIRLNNTGDGKHGDLLVSTVLWRLIMKRVLTPLNKWSDCEHCDGPWVGYGVQPSAKLPRPFGKRLASSQAASAQGVFLEARWITDERLFEERSIPEFDVNMLLKEAANLVEEGDIQEVPSGKLGPTLLSIQPVRVAVEQRVVIAFMGGKRGFIVNPRDSTVPAFNGFMVGGESRSHPQIVNFERFF